jgi:hypothetical protein
VFEDVCYGTDVPLVVTAVQEAYSIQCWPILTNTSTVFSIPLSAAMPLSESHQLRWWMLTPYVVSGQDVHSFVAITSTAGRVYSRYYSIAKPVEWQVLIGRICNMEPEQD